jgi:hypothetical protein
VRNEEVEDKKIVTVADEGLSYLFLLEKIEQVPKFWSRTKRAQHSVVFFLER